jgi:hypothetical protein
VVDNLTIDSLPQGLITFAILSEIWAGDFHIDFAVLNALVSKHFTHIPLQDVVCKRVEDTAGFIRYSISHAEVGNLCEVYVQKLPRGLVRLSVIPPKDDTPPGWSDEQQSKVY